jgi:hypothetical protein
MSVGANKRVATEEFHAIIVRGDDLPCTAASNEPNLLKLHGTGWHSVVHMRSRASAPPMLAVCIGAMFCPIELESGEIGYNSSTEAENVENSVSVHLPQALPADCYFCGEYVQSGTFGAVLGTCCSLRPSARRSH